jgi:ribonuclease R
LGRKAGLSQGAGGRAHRQHGFAPHHQPDRHPRPWHSHRISGKRDRRSQGGPCRSPRRVRTDLRAIPLVTIDPEDARDHDDAVWAGPDDDAANKGGHVVLVAIADVAHYVTPGSALDKEALKRGNSAYFPDRVVPMLPEELSADLCSLKEGVDRPCLAVRMVFDAQGRKIAHKFMRGVMRSAARLTYARRKKL